MTYNVTIFQNIRTTDTPFFRPVEKILERIKEGATKDLVKKIRAEKNKPERNELKKQLPAICFSGTFNKRADNSLIEHSGLICLDFDGYEKQKTLLQDKENLSKNKYVYSVFIFSFCRVFRIGSFEKYSESNQKKFPEKWSVNPNLSLFSE